MSLGPDKVVFSYDMFSGTAYPGSGGTGITGTGAGPVIMLPPGTKVIQQVNPSTAVGTVKVQNSLDRTTWFDVTSYAGTESHLLEVVSAVPFWRANVTVFTTAASAANPFVAVIAQNQL